MKTIINPSVSESAHYRCDLTGAPLPIGPAAVIRIICGYGAPYDGDRFDLDLSAEAADVVIPFLRAVLLDGDAIQPHRVDSLFSPEELNEKPISPRERTKLICELGRLRRQRATSRATAAVGPPVRVEEMADEGPNFECLGDKPKMTSAEKREIRQCMMQIFGTQLFRH